ncbi:ATP-binding protein [uncultured Methanobacterium sp.]|uniref:ATP-binding protein n=1 Tax=uncultured Methanobacterium sp. TaxID=176306 RepID=UPI002AA79906|nr:ATP-binding protein [uncultured Methanobacterium sp.]
MNYYHDEKMQKIFQALKQPKNLDDLQLSDSLVKGLILKIISSYGTVKTSTINELTGIHWDILEESLSQMEKSGFCAPVSGGFLFSSVEYTITRKGREKVRGIAEENPYIGIAPVPYEEYFQIMKIQIHHRYPLEIPPEVVQETFHQVVGVDYAKEALIESSIIGKGIFVYGPPGTGKTFIISTMPNLLPPLVIPKYIEFGGKIIQLYDPDFHKMCEEQPNDPRWVKIYAPFVLTGAELNLNKLETNYDPNKGVYETSPLIKANGGILLIDDLGRQRDDHELILNRLIVPMENKKDVVYVRGIPVILHTHFIPAFSTNLDISIMDEAHLRRAPLHIFLQNPKIEEVTEVFRRNLEDLQESFQPEVLTRFMKVYQSKKEGGEGLQPSFAHARDVAQICQSVRINKKKDTIDTEVLEAALDKHVLVVLQRMNIDIAQISHKTRSFRLKTDDLERTYDELTNYGAGLVCYENNSIITDVDESTSPVELANYLCGKNIKVESIDLIAESEKELRRTLLNW